MPVGTRLTGSAAAQSPNGVKTLTPAGAIKTTGTWDLGARAGDFVYVAGMRGIDPKTNTLVQGDEARIRQGFLNMQMIAASEGASLQDCARIAQLTCDQTCTGQAQLRLHSTHAARENVQGIYQSL